MNGFSGLAGANIPLKAWLIGLIGGLLLYASERFTTWRRARNAKRWRW